MPPADLANAAPQATLVVNRDNSRWQTAVCVLFAVAAIGSVCSPPIANIGAALGLLAFFLVPGAWDRLFAAARRPLGVGVLVLLATMAVAMLWGDAPWNKRLAAWWSWRPLILMLVATAAFDTREAKDRFCLTLVAVLALGSLASFVLLAMPNPVVLDEPGILLRNHTTQGMAFSVAAILAATMAWGRPVAVRSRLLLFVAIALFVANIAFITAGRSAYVALLTASAVLAYRLMTGPRRWLAVVGVVVVGLAILASSSLVRERFSKGIEEIGTANTVTSETSIGSRIVIWHVTRDLIARRPLLGYGMGGFPDAYTQEVQNRRDLAWRADVHDPQNEYLRIVVEAGVPGALAFLVFVVGVLRQNAAPPYRAAGLALFAAWLVTSFFNSHFQTFAEAHLIGLVLGTLLGNGSGYGAREAGAGDASTSAAVTAASTSS